MAKPNRGGTMMAINASNLHAKDMADPAYREAYESLESEFELINALLQLRASDQIPDRLSTTKIIICPSQFATARKSE
jgi:hypothetical protein